MSEDSLKDGPWNKCICKKLEVDVANGWDEEESFGMETFSYWTLFAYSRSFYHALDILYLHSSLKHISFGYYVYIY